MATPELTPTNNQGELESPWVPAPGSSHLVKFKFFDRSGSEFGASPEIWITYSGKGKPDPTYKYKPSSHETAREIFASLCGAAHPGEVVDSQLKKPRVPYEGPFYV